MRIRYAIAFVAFLAITLTASLAYGPIKEAVIDAHTHDLPVPAEDGSVCLGRDVDIETVPVEIATIVTDETCPSGYRSFSTTGENP